ncbi:cactus-binding C-terminus of cactin protein-domain-containing protein [Tribonema minus]|uniref:Splicing factor Cactin n=1 Tax=Tribonema minus TaxID=303371 RepID=A0A835YNE1_9STRA|nr:cactus-binding C-terminus of cactin protein-domain-containing protein [Tribonema minus]
MGRKRRSRSPSSSGSGSDSQSGSSDDRKRKSSKKKQKSSSERRHRSPSSSSSVSDDARRRKRHSSEDSDGAKAEERKRRKEEKLAEKIRRKKEERRQKETPEQRAARKAASKQTGTAARFGYSNDSNPFGDSNLEEQFTWRKKLDKEGTDPAAVTKKQLRDAHQAKLEEIEKVRKRREESEKEKEEFERLKAEEARLREQQQYGDWQRKEEEFHLHQAKTRSKIRLIEGRERPIDMVAKNLLIFGEAPAGPGVGGGIHYSSGRELDTSSLEIELREPYRLCEGLSVAELEELAADVRAYQEMEDAQEGANRAFWAALGVVCADELARAQEAAGIVPAAAGLHKNVRGDVAALLEGRDAARLEELREQVDGRVQRGEGDVDYWAAVSQQLRAHAARAALRALHEAMLQRQLERLEALREERARRRAEAIELGEPLPEDLQPAAAAAAGDGGGAAAAAADRDASDAALALEVAERGKGLEDLEDAMGLGDEVDTSGTTYWWNDKYRPRKPRYFNRVKTGYDWNKYNQSHYDHDNPPPKTVQGYKFNVFYPDLLDRSVTPQFKLEPSDHPDMAIIRFTAGPPYEDIAFKIVNREWEYARKRGFRCVFERGVLSLFFNFKRHRYRK